ncbi:MAG TPA: Gfo/Idh/MocA family oxidoreductase [Gemmatimonadaceae bacterium]|nr:Gfo/Idh/MocA family oxidoreductase [Gemmatimonadaceae bacterium]
MRRPRLGFAGVGWIGRQRMQSIAADDACDVIVVVDESVEAAHNAVVGLTVAPRLCRRFEEALESNLDGLVIATPSALHAAQAVAALDRGIAVFCQKPLARTAAETRTVMAAARANDRLLGVDLSYRWTTGMRRVRDLVQSGALGDIYAVDLVFHNAYGPDKAWFFDPELSGGGCVIDLGIHLVDLALWTLGFPCIVGASSRLFARGHPLGDDRTVVEDYAVARLDLESGAVIQLACSWNLSAGRDAVIGASFYGPAGGASLRNVGGSFYDFVAERWIGTRCETLASPPDEWGGRAAVDWSRRLVDGGRYDPSIEQLGNVAAALDRIYGR